MGNSPCDGIEVPAGRRRIALPTARSARTLWGMQTYVLLSTLSANGVETLKKNPTRLQQVNAQIEAMGARILDQWAVLGPYDFVTIIEAPDHLTVARIAVELGARGSTRIQSLPAIPVGDFLDALSEARGQ
jgi:uncharacterized protein with GYD domain